VTRVVDGFAGAGLPNGVRFVVQSEDLPWVYADPQQITTVLSNFLDNASKYAPSGSDVQVRIVHSDAADGLRVEVRDRGPGFPAELAPRLFERFFRAEGPPRAGREGLGIGLALAHELIVLHGGRIGAFNWHDDSQTQRQGACFWFELPLGSAHVAIDELVLDAGEAGPYPSPETDREPESASLLLVEDHPVLAAYLAERLAEHGPVVVAPDAESAWTRLLQHRIGLVVSDVVLPGSSGTELCRRIKADPALTGIPVLLISAKAGKSDRQAGLDAGAFDWLTKPFGLETLLGAVQRAWPNFARAEAATPATRSRPDRAHPEKDAARPPDRLLELALAQLHQADFGPAEWSERAHLSGRQLRRRVTELTGMSPVAWLREQRLLRVRELITSGTCRTLADAGATAGIDNAGYLYRLYRARFSE
jgi:CheY-like chemotaxis protein